MPPDAIASSEVVTIWRVRGDSSFRYERSITSRAIVDGNFGALPNPPHCSSNVESYCCTAAANTSIGGRFGLEEICDVRPMFSTSASTLLSMSALRFRHASSTAFMSCKKVGLG